MKSSPFPTRTCGFALAAALLLALPMVAVANGDLRGTVTLEQTGGPLSGAAVVIVELGESTESDRDGNYEFRNVRPGRYHVVAHLDHVFSQFGQVVEIVAGEEATSDFRLSLGVEKTHIAVTASAEPETPFESFQDVEVFDSFNLNESAAASLGEVLDHRVGTGIAKRSFGPGSSRPIIRGFDGDRVLIMEDGIRTGTLSASSGDHGEVMNPMQLESLEVVKGPATLLYSGNAVGGTVNAISRHHEHHPHPHQGMRGVISGSGGTTNALGGASAGFELGAGPVQIWGNAGGIRSGDYTAPVQGKIDNTRTQFVNGGGGFGIYGERMYFTAEAKTFSGAYGVPFAEEFHSHGEHDHEEEEHEGEEHKGEEEEEEGEDHDHEEEEIESVTLEPRLHNYRATWGLHDLDSAIEGILVKLSYTDWEHSEIETFHDGDSHVGTVFENKQLIYRAEFDQNNFGPLSGRFGIWGIDRDFQAEGEEALSPPISNTGFAFFALQEANFERFKVQFGGRVETQRFRPAYSERGGDDHDHEEEHEGEMHEGEEHEGEEEEHHEPEAPDAVDRTFTGASAALGIHIDTWEGGALVSNFSHSYRPPALEELYNFGPHAGTIAFEVGDPSLRAERGTGFDVSLRQGLGRVQGELNYFLYEFDNFIFPFATGEVFDGLREIQFTQRAARFTGAEASLRVRTHEHVLLECGLDHVRARDPELNAPLPRIPPLRGRVGATFSGGGFRIAPELILASEQASTFTGETRTPGYSVVNLKASYTVAGPTLAHQFSVAVFNAGDRLYRNHSSFIKDLAPEMGRALRVSYTARFF